MNAAGYITKGGSPAELVSAIRTVASGRKYVSPALAEILAARLGSHAPGIPHEGLSEREHTVLCMLAFGKTITEIAHELSLSPRTVSTYRARTLRKMGAKTNAELIAYAVRNHLCE